LSEPRKNRISVDIYGQQYVIVGTESTSHIRLVASMVDEKMREISKANPTLDISKLAVLTAVNAVSDLIKIKDLLDRREEEYNNREKENKKEKE
jgi:cell division protein ZapA